MCDFQQCYLSICVGMTLLSEDLFGHLFPSNVLQWKPSFNRSIFSLYNFLSPLLFTVIRETLFLSIPVLLVPKTALVGIRKVDFSNWGLVVFGRVKRDEIFEKRGQRA